MRRLHRRLQAGVEFNPSADEVGPLATLFLVLEGPSRPGLFLGTSSDRIGSPEGTQGYYLTATKYLEPWRVAPYLTAHYSEWDSEFKIPFGAALDVGGGVVLRPMYDGERSHVTLGLSRGPATITALWVWLERAGGAVTVVF